MKIISPVNNAFYQNIGCADSVINRGLEWEFVEACSNCSWVRLHMQIHLGML